MSESTLTQNKNLLSPSTYRLVIDQTRFANIEYFCVNAKLPALSLDAAAESWRGHENWVPGDRVNYNPLDLRILIDENMRNYLELLGWLKDNQSSTVMTKSDLILTVCTSKNNPNRRFRFVDAFPISIGEVVFDAQLTDVQYLTVDGVFRYTYFEALPGGG